MNTKHCTVITSKTTQEQNQCKLLKKVGTLSVKHVYIPLYKRIKSPLGLFNSAMRFVEGDGN